MEGSQVVWNIAWKTMFSLAPCRASADVVTYESDSLDELEPSFILAVEDYIETVRVLDFDMMAYGVISRWKSGNHSDDLEKEAHLQGLISEAIASVDKRFFNWS